MSKEFTVKPIGFVRSARNEPIDDGWDGIETRIELDAKELEPDAVLGLSSFRISRSFSCSIAPIPRRLAAARAVRVDAKTGHSPEFSRSARRTARTGSVSPR